MASDPLPPPTAAKQPKFLNRIRAACRVRHYSIRTEAAYVAWGRRFIPFHNKRHPLEMGTAEINAFLTHLFGVVKAATTIATTWSCYTAIVIVGFTVRNVDGLKPRLARVVATGLSRMK